jgi:drug/metabolite transporter (DMT)-like permease
VTAQGARDVKGRGIGAALCVAAAATLWGLWPLWVHLGPAGGTQTATVGFFTTGVIGTPVALAWRRRSATRPPRPLKAWLGLALLGAFDAANVWFYFRALDVGAVAPAVLSHYLAPVLLALAAPLVLGEPRSSRTPAGLLLALGGTAVLVLTGPDASTAAGQATRQALLYGSASAVCYAGAVLVSKSQSGRFNDAELMAYHALVSAALLAPFTGLPRTPRFIIGPMAGGLVSGLGGGILYYAGLRRLPAERTGVLTYIEPLAALLVGWVFMAEPATPAAAIGAVLILGAGLLVVTAPALPQAPADHPAPPPPAG